MEARVISKVPMPRHPIAAILTGPGHLGQISFLV